MPSPPLPLFAAGYPLHSQVVTGIHFGTDSIVACSHDGTVRRTSLRSDAILATANCPYTALTLLSGGRILASRWDGGTDLVDPHGPGRSFSRLDLGPATAIGTSPDGRVFIGFMSRRIWVLDDDMSFRESLRGHGEEITAVAGLSASTLISGSTDQTICIWDVADQPFTPPPEGHDGPVSALLLADNTLVSGSADGSLRTWGLDGEQLDVSAADPASALRGCSFRRAPRSRSRAPPLTPALARRACGSAGVDAGGNDQDRRAALLGHHPVVLRPVIVLAARGGEDLPEQFGQRGGFQPPLGVVGPGQLRAPFDGGPPPPGAERRA